MPKDGLPTPLKNNPDFWFLKHIWWKLQAPQNKHFAGVVCAESGAGKTYASMACAEAIYPDLNPNESIAFSAKQFAGIAKERHKKAFPLILDDAGISAFSGDALTKEVGSVSKISQSIRHKHWQVWMSLPHEDLLAKSVRLTNHYYMEPVWIDYETRYCHAKFQRRVIRGNYKHPITYNPSKESYSINPVTGYNEKRIEKFLTTPIPHPRDSIAKEYEKIRREFMDKFRENTEIEIEKREEKRLRKRLSDLDMINIVYSRPQDFMYNEKLSTARVMDKFKVSSSAAYVVIKNVKEKQGVDEMKV